jgi:hypothetical protein
MNQIWFLILFFTILLILYHYCPKVTLFLLKPQVTFIQKIDQPSVDLNSIVQRIKIPEKLPIVLKKLYKKHRSASPGFIYIYHEDTTGDYKIGRTRADVGVEKRIKQHRRKCCKSLLLVDKFFTRNHEHAELMIHQELRANGNWIKFKDCICKSKHQEFFRGSKDELVDCIAFWTDFFNGTAGIQEK